LNAAPVASRDQSPYIASMDSPPRLTSAAAARVAAIAARQGKPGLMLRLAVDGGGCAGFQYRFGLEANPSADDVAVETDGVTMLIDPDSLPFLAGSEIDYVEKIGAAAFEVRNPNAASGCGCGSSFSV
jgi:iron-sulfur cluster assembly accessory protein